MALKSETCVIGLEMENPATSKGMVQVLRSFTPLLPLVSSSPRKCQKTLLGCDQNFFERGNVIKCIIFISYEYITLF